MFNFYSSESVSGLESEIYSLLLFEFYKHKDYILTSSKTRFKC